MLANVTLLLPELVLFIGAMGLLMVGALPPPMQRAS